MIKKSLICVVCPVGCHIVADMEKNKVIKITGNKCPKGEEYVLSEMRNPVRVLTTSVLAEGMPFKLIPVKTDRPIPKARLLEAMREVKKVRVDRPIHVGDIVAANFLGTDANLVATREFFHPGLRKKEKPGQGEK